MSLQAATVCGESDDEGKENQAMCCKGEVQQNTKATKDEVLESDCPICLQKFLHPVILPCNHVFCYLCCKGEGMKRKRCAMCRSEIPPEYFYKPTLLDSNSSAADTGDKSKLVEVKPTTEDGYQWFYEGRNGWWQYDERSSIEIEQHFKDGKTSAEMLIAGSLYVIDFEQMRQHRTSYPGRFRKIKRDLCTIPIKGIAGLRIKKDKAAPPAKPGETPAVSDRPQAEGNETALADKAPGGATRKTKLTSQRKSSHTHSNNDNENSAPLGDSNSDRLNSNGAAEGSNGKGIVVATSMHVLHTNSPRSRSGAGSDIDGINDSSGQNSSSDSRVNRRPELATRTVSINPNDSSRADCRAISTSGLNRVNPTVSHRIRSNPDSQGRLSSNSDRRSTESNEYIDELDNSTPADLLSNDIYPLAFHTTDNSQGAPARRGNSLTTQDNRSQENGNVQYSGSERNSTNAPAFVSGAESSIRGDSVNIGMTREGLRPRRPNRSRSDQSE